MAVGLVGSLLGSFILVRALLRPLHNLSAYTLEVAAGNYNAAIDYQARDAISETIDSGQEHDR